MRGDLYSGYVVLGADFPPTLNKEDDPTTLKPVETPAAYGLACEKDGYLAAGTIPTASTVVETTVLKGATTYYWYYDRLMRSSGNVLYIGAPYYRDVFHRQGRGQIEAYATITSFFPISNNDLILITATGSHIVSAGNQTDYNFRPTQFIQGFYAAAKANTCSMNGTAFVSNDKGVFSWTGGEIKEWTRPVRDSIGNFTTATIAPDFYKRFLIGATKFVVDTEKEKLFDYGTSGFLYTSRTLSQQPTMAPFKVGAIALDITFTDGNDGSLSWESKIEDEDWWTEQDVVLSCVDNKKTRVILPIENPVRTGHKFQMRITALSSNVYIRKIEVNVQDYADQSIAK